MGDYYLMHYGIKGMKWGIRRFQNPDGTLTAEGKIRAKQEYKADNKRAFDLGADATIAARSSSIANKKALRAKVKYDKKPTIKKEKKALVAARTAEKLAKDANDAAEKAKQHYKELIDKYGKEAVSNIKYDRKGRINERIHNGEDYAWASVLAAEKLGKLALTMSTGVYFFTPYSALPYVGIAAFTAPKGAAAKLNYAAAKSDVKNQLKKKDYEERVR